MQFKEIISLIREKSPTGLQRLYECYGSKFYSYCIVRWKLSEDDAWDVIYRTLETVVLKGAEYDFESDQHFNNFLFKILVNFLRQQYRRKQTNETELEFVDLSDEFHTPIAIKARANQDAIEEYYRTESVDSPLLTAMKSALDTFEPLDKDLLLLRAQNYSYDEIAKLLDIENNQLKVKHHRAKQKLVNLLKNTPHATQQ